MYGKVFALIYDGTLYGHWEAIVTMQQLIVLATPDGVVDMTPQAIAARTSIPFEIISKGLQILAEPDPYTRTPGEDGKRIVLLDEHRPWGWRLVNHGKYQRLRNVEQKRAADRERMAEKRNKNNGVAIESESVANVAHSYSPSNTKEKTIVGLAPDHSQINGRRALQKQQAVEVIEFLNEKAGKHYQPVKQNVDLIIGLLASGVTPDDLRAVVAKKCREWKGKPEMHIYLRPATLFGPKNFHGKYHGEIPPAERPQ